MLALFVLCINRPLYYAIYQGRHGERQIAPSYPHPLTLLHHASIDEKPSLALPLMYEAVRGYKICAMYYVSGPGNLSALKLTHIFLHSIALVGSTPLYATDSFSILSDTHIHAFGNKYFTLKAPLIYAPPLDEASKRANLALAHSHITHTTCHLPPPTHTFTPPQTLPIEHFALPCEPLYILPPI